MDALQKEQLKVESQRFDHQAIRDSDFAVEARLKRKRRRGSEDEDEPNNKRVRFTEEIEEHEADERFKTDLTEAID